MVFCQLCQNNPCLWCVHGEQVLNDAQWMIYTYGIENEGAYPSNSMIRHRCYTTYTFLRHGLIGQGQRRQIPICVTNSRDIPMCVVNAI